MTARPIAVRVSDLPTHLGTDYPAPHDAPCRQRARRVHEGVLGERPVRQHRPADDPVSGGEARHVRRGRHDLPAQLDAGAERQRRADLVGAKAHQRVGEVRRGREHPHQELPGTR